MRPIGDALHEGIGRDQHDHEEAEQDRQAIEREEDRRAERELQEHERDRGFDADRARGDRPHAGALDLGVEVAIDDVVEGAAGAAHHHRADAEQHDQLPIGPASGREGDAPPAREEQQPGTDRPVEPRQADIWPEHLRRAAIDPIAGADIGAKLGHAVVLNTPKAVVLYGILDVIN